MKAKLLAITLPVLMLGPVSTYGAGEPPDTLTNLVGRLRLGVALGFEHFKSRYVSEAESVGTEKIVRVTDSQSYQPSLWLTTTYAFKDAFGILNSQEQSTSGWGLYAGIRAFGAGSDSKMFDALSIGPTWISRRAPLDGKPSGTETLNVGFGPVWHRTRVLASGIEEGKPLPSSYNEVKFERKDEVSWMLMISAGF